MATEYGTRLRAARKYAKLTQLAASKKTGIPQSTISTAERLGNGSSDTSVYAQAYNVNPHWITTGEGRMELNAIERAAFARPHENIASVAINLVDNPDYPSIRRANIKLSAGASGFGIDYIEDDEAPIVFQRKWFERNGYNPAQLLAVRVMNGSMEPGLYDGDTVVINTADAQPKDGQVYAMNYEGELVIKRLVRDAGQWWLASDNPDQRRYPRKVCGDDVFCVGRIVHKQSEKI